MALTKKVLILQGSIPFYRIPFFNKLGSRKDVRLTVMYSGRRIKTQGLFFKSVHIPALNFGHLKFQFITFLKLKKFDVVIIPMDVTWLSTVLLCLLRKKKSYLLWGHGLGKSRFANWIRVWMVKKSTGVILYGDEIRPYFETLTRNVFIAPNTIDVPNTGFDDSALRHTFLYVGRPQSRKKIEELIIGFASIVDRIPSSITVEIVGSKNPRLVYIARKYGIEKRINFAGESHDDAFIQAFFNRALAYVSPGHVGLGALHSFAYGVPVVTRRKAAHAPEFHNLIDGENALLYDGSIMGLSEILLRLVLDQNLSKLLGYQGYRLYHNKRSIDCMVNGFMDAICQGE